MQRIRNKFRYRHGFECNVYLLYIFDLQVQNAGKTELTRVERGVLIKTMN